MNTKRKLAEALREEMKTTSIPRIRISDLTEKAGINRQTFYYHYHDIYDLLEDMYDRMLAEVLDYDSAGEKWTNHLYDMCICLRDNRNFVEKGYHEIDHERYESMIRKAIRHLIDASLDHAEAHLSPYDHILVTDFYANAVTSIILKWIKSGMSQDPQELCRKIKIMVNDGYTIAVGSFAAQN